MNRALQLEAALRSFFLRGTDAGRVDITVIWKATEENLARQYRELIEEYKHLPAVSFRREVHFRRDLLELLAGKAGLSPQDLQELKQIAQTGVEKQGGDDSEVPYRHRAANRDKREYGKVVQYINFKE